MHEAAAHDRRRRRRRDTLSTVIFHCDVTRYLYSRGEYSQPADKRFLLIQSDSRAAADTIVLILSLSHKRIRLADSHLTEFRSRLIFNQLMRR